MYIAKNSFEWKDILICAEEKIFDPYATGAYAFRFDLIFWSGLNSIVRA